MALKLIPVEGAPGGGCAQGKKQKHFNPGNKIKKGASRGGQSGSLKHICLRLVHFINRGGKFTYEQIDDLIMGLQHSILNLQKKKQDILKKRSRG